MKPISQLFQTDSTSETAGVRVEFGEYGAFTIARSGGGNAAFRKRFEQLMRPHKAAFNLGALDDTTERDISARAFADTVVKGWELVDEDGASIPFSPEACYQLLLKLPNLLDELLKESQRIANFLTTSRADEGKA